MSAKLTTDEFIDRLASLTNDIVAIDDYHGMSIDMSFQCHKGHVFQSRPANILNRLSCPVCSGKKIVRGFNDLWTLRPDVARLLNDEEEGYSCGVGSNKKLEFVCPTCGMLSFKAVKKMTRYGFSCSYCSDGISFPNKVLRYILNHTDAKNISFEYNPEWAGLRRYDGYFTYKMKPYIVEMDGGIGHGNKDYCSREDDIKLILIDKEKDRLALEHGIDVIRIDCNYDDICDRFEYIKSNILTSKLADILNLSNINWNDCFNFAVSSLVKEAADLYNNGLTIKNIAKKLQIHRKTVCVYLKQAKEIGICDYDKDEAYRRSYRKNTECSLKTFQYTLDGELVATYPSAAEARRQTGINNIAACITGTYKTAGGFLWENERSLMKKNN